MTKAPEPLSAFEIVLSDEQLEDLGRFTALFSQIDSMMFQIISLATKTRTQDLMALIEGTTSGQRLAMLRRLAENMEDKQARAKAEGVCSGLAALNDKRNHILHGVWGLLWNTEKDTLKAACVYERNRQNPLHAQQLPELCERAAKLSLKVMELLRTLNPAYFKPPPAQPPHRLLLAAGPPPNRPPPEWQPQPSRRSSPPNPNPDPAK